MQCSGGSGYATLHAWNDEVKHDTPQADPTIPSYCMRPPHNKTAIVIAVCDFPIAAYALTNAWAH